MDARDIHGTVYARGTAALLARVEDTVGETLSAGVVTAAEYSIWSVDKRSPHSRSPVSGHEAVTVDVAILHEMRQDATWQVDEVGYNLTFRPDVREHDAFPDPGGVYLVEVRLHTDDQPVLVRFRLNAI